MDDIEKSIENGAQGEDTEEESRIGTNDQAEVAEVCIIVR